MYIRLDYSDALYTCTFPVGPRVPTSRDPLEMFSHFMDDTFLSNIVRETNRYAAQHTSPHMHSTWETDLEELKAYLGFMIVMGLNHLPEICDYWSTDPMLQCNPDNPRQIQGNLPELALR